MLGGGAHSEVLTRISLTSTPQGSTLQGMLRLLLKEAQGQLLHRAGSSAGFARG